ncbi:MAG: hypothetical protein P4L50_03065 [Anaerolineaceae bacterium]|nr:hypothetical protein [Anaerolineaceae bacterium]
MSKKTIGMVLLVAGVLVIVAVLVAGLAGYPSAGFGLKKIAVAVVGVVALVVGIGFTFQKKAG